MYEDWSTSRLTRPADIRFFCKITDLQKREDGTCERARVGIFDRTSLGLGWRRLFVGQRAHWSPFKLKLEHTKRAGLHLVCTFRRGTPELRFVSSIAIEKEGIFVITPSRVVENVERLEDVTGSDHQTIFLSLHQQYGIVGRQLRLALRDARDLPDEFAAEVARSEGFVVEGERAVAA